MTSALLGIDLGTSAVKALLVTPDGELTGSGSAEYPISHPAANFAEQNPDGWWRGAQQAVHAAMAAAGDGVSVVGIGLSGQMHGTVLLDERGELLHPAIIWPDQRSASQVTEITARIGAERLVEIAGSPVATGFQAATLLWMQQERPDLWAKVRHALLPKDYLRWRMTGEYASDPSDGSGALLLDVNSRSWSPTIAQALGIDLSILPPLLSSTAIAGGLTADAAAALGLPPATPVVTGGADTACSMLGAGVVQAHTLIVTLSTGGQQILPASQPLVDRHGRIHTFCSALQPGKDRAGWYHMGATLTAGMALRWLRDNILDFQGENAYDQMLALAAQVSAGANGLIFLPYLVGERTPHMDPTARGLFFGLTLQHTNAHFVRAVIEGVAFACFDAFRVLTEVADAPQQIVLAGGGSRSALWQQIVADVFGAPVRRLLVDGQSAVGAVLLAGEGVGLWDASQTAVEWARYGPPLQPNSTHQAVYQDAFARFQAVYAANRPLFKQTASKS